MFRLIQKLWRGLTYKIYAPLYNYLILRSSGVNIYKPYKIFGRIYLDNENSKIIIQEGFYVNSAFIYNNIGRQQRTSIICDHGTLRIGKNVGISSSTIVCHREISIGNNVLIGGNCVIYDTDFHSLDADLRASHKEPRDSIGMKAVEIGNNVFIGAHSTILKGTVIGDNSVIGAGSLLAGSIVPSNQVWAGNPAKFIKNLS